MTDRTRHDALTGGILPPGRRRTPPPIRLRPKRERAPWLVRLMRRKSVLGWFLTGLLAAPLACAIVIALGFAYMLAY